MVCCAAFNCRNRPTSAAKRSQVLQPPVAFFRFPVKDAVVCQAWIDFVNRKDWELNENSRLCSVHFEERWMLRKVGGKRVDLVAGAIPSIQASAVPRYSSIKRQLNVPPEGHTKYGLKVDEVAIESGSPAGNLEPCTWIPESNTVQVSTDEDGDRRVHEPVCLFTQGDSRGENNVPESTINNSPSDKNYYLREVCRKIENGVVVKRYTLAMTPKCSKLPVKEANSVKRNQLKISEPIALPALVDHEYFLPSISWEDLKGNRGSDGVVSDTIKATNSGTALSNDSVEVQSDNVDLDEKPVKDDVEKYVSSKQGVKGKFLIQSDLDKGKVGDSKSSFGTQPKPVKREEVVKAPISHEDLKVARNSDGVVSDGSKVINSETALSDDSVELQSDCIGDNVDLDEQPVKDVEKYVSCKQGAKGKIVIQSDLEKGKVGDSKSSLRSRPKLIKRKKVVQVGCDSGVKRSCRVDKEQQTERSSMVPISEFTKVEQERTEYKKKLFESERRVKMLTDQLGVVRKKLKVLQRFRQRAELRKQKKEEDQEKSVTVFIVKGERPRIISKES